jgi:hypothetical protein
MEETLSLAPFRHILGRLRTVRIKNGNHGDYQVRLYSGQEDRRLARTRLASYGASATAERAPIIMDAGIDFFDAAPAGNRFSTITTLEEHD